MPDSQLKQLQGEPSIDRVKDLPTAAPLPSAGRLWLDVGLVGSRRVKTEVSPQPYTMVIIDSEEFKSPTPTLSLPAYTPVDPHNSLGLPLPPPRSPGARPSSPFSAPASNYLTIKREKADITGSWNINTALPAPTLNRSFSLGSDDGDTTSDGGTEVSDPSTQATSVSSSSSPSTPSVPPNLKLLTPRGKIDAVIRVWGGPRAWIETVSRDEDVAVTFVHNWECPGSSTHVVYGHIASPIRRRSSAQFTVPVGRTLAVGASNCQATYSRRIPRKGQVRFNFEFKFSRRNL
ncbi:hypothetical protein AG1IA_07932 [Rhizoctonia solani AG-1 IA]|uniref:Uncharacterized protein n=1 Tax=Thanatephorus cucumeris (strain AG1-IA) TaxID=983506 RepID=L8WMM0_THACA|nr:hypothetical protein AG1IA_07932 [Rhizoctonia solani AG-1 IA]